MCFVFCESYFLRINQPRTLLVGSKPEGRSPKPLNPER